MSATFDVVAHCRDRARDAEARATMLETEFAKATRLLALAVKAAAGDDCDPLVLLKTLEGLDQVDQTQPQPVKAKRPKPADWIFPRGYVFPGHERAVADLRARWAREDNGPPIDQLVELLRDTDPAEASERRD